jgi:hypothetical protein
MFLNSNPKPENHKTEQNKEINLKINKILCFSNLNKENAISVIISMEGYLNKNIHGYARIN